MVPPKLLIAGGVALLIFGSAGFVYNVTRPRPPLVALPAEALPVTEVEAKQETQAPTPSPSPDTASVSLTNSNLSRAQHNASPPPRSLAINIVSPSMGQTFTAPANVTLKAVVRPFGHDLQKVEFFRAPEGKSVCRSLSKGNETDGLTKIGESLSAPYEYVWNNLDKGIYNLMAVATYEEGEQQFSRPIVIIINEADNYEGDKWRGWRPPYSPEQSLAQDDSLLSGFEVIEFTSAVGNASANTEPLLNRKCPDIVDFVKYETTTVPEVYEVNTCPYNASERQNSATQFKLFNDLIGGVYSNFPSFKYWVTGGKVIGEGANAVWDLSDVKLHPGIYTAIVQADDGCDCISVSTTQVRVTNFCSPCITISCAASDSPSDTQNFFASVQDFVHAGTPTYHWRNSKGKIISGQGTPMVSIDTTGLPDGTEYLVTVSIPGIQSYCLNQLSYKAVAGRPCFHEEVHLLSGALKTILTSRAAKRRKPKNEESTSETEGIEDQNDGEPAEGPIAKPAINEKEWIEVKWAPRVEIQRSFSIVVTYNRTTESVEVSDKAGNLVEVLNLSGAFKLLKERYGPDYEVYANVKLRTSGFECATCNEESYQSLDNQRAEWSWNVLPNKSGTQTFNLELWVKGVPRVDGKAPRGPEKTSWSKNDLKVEVWEPKLTRNAIFATSLFLGIAGVGFSIKGIKIYRVGDTYNVEHAVAVGRNVTMQNTTVHQTKENTIVNQNTEEKK